MHGEDGLRTGVCIITGIIILIETVLTQVIQTTWPQYTVNGVNDAVGYGSIGIHNTGAVYIYLT